MLNAPVGVPARELVPAGLPDVGRVSWTLARAYSPGRRVVLALATLPWWALYVVLQHGVVHDGGDVVAVVTRARAGPPAGFLLRRTATVLVGAVVIGPVAGVVAGLTGLLTGSEAVGWSVVLLWPVAGLVVAAASIVGTVTRQSRAHRAALRTTGRDQRRADLAVVRDRHRVVVGAVAARPGLDGLAAVAAHVRATVRPGEVIVVGAATDRHVRAYRRFGLRPLPSLPLILTATVDEAKTP
jgi:hypothetical protein